MSTITDREFNTMLDPELFGAILDSMGEAIWIIDFNKPYPYWFASVENKFKFGVPLDPISPNFWRDNIHPDDYQRAVNGFQQALNSVDTHLYVHEYRFCGAGNIYYTIHDRMRFLRDEKGTAYRVIGSWRDVTQERQREKKLEEMFEALEQERNRFRTIAELSNAAMWEIDFRTSRMQWKAGNATLEDFGFNNPGYTINDWIAAVHADDRERVLQNFNRAVATEESYFDSYRFLRKDGKIVHLIDQGAIIRDDAGRAVRGVGSWIDITRERSREEVLERSLEQQRMLNHELQVREEELATTEEELRQINDQLSVHIQQLSEREFILNQSQKLARIASWEYDPLTKTMFWSNELYNIYGVDHAFDISNLQEIQKLHDEASARLVSDSFLAMLHHQLPFDITVQLKTPLGYKKWVRMTAHPQTEAGHLRRVLGLSYDITFFKEAEERLKTSEEKFSKAFRYSPDLMSIHRESDGVIVDVNDNAYPVLGYRRDEVVGVPAQSLNLFVDPSDRDRFYDQFNKSGHAQIETRWRRKDGSQIDVHISSNRIEFENDRYLLNVVQNISGRKAAEERFIKAFDLSPDLMLVFRERDLLLIDVNSKLAPISGYSREEVIGKSSHDFELWVDLEARQRYFEAYFADGFVSMESLFRKKDGGTFYASINAQRISLSGENHLLVVVRDVTERKLAEERILQSEANLHSVMNNTDLLVWSWDRESRLTAFNEPFRRYMRKMYNREIFVGKGFLLDVNTPDMINLRKKWGAWQVRALAGESFKVQEQRGGRHWQFSISPIRGHEMITGVTVFAEDITDRRAAEARIIENEARLDAIINNTDMAIWSVDLNYRVTAINKVFYNMLSFAGEHPNAVGSDIFELSRHALPPEYLDHWQVLYKRAFAGESVLEEMDVNGRSLLASVHPIIEYNRIIGASVYTQDITERKQKEEEFNRRTRELAEANKKIGGLKLMALRSVMNPHFIFNALNSIQYFIAKNDRQNAINYLSTFSKLVRGVLTHSVNDKTTLADELDVLKHYINLEMVRFENKFSFVLNIDPELDLEQIEIPSLLIQPYVENAILHGLYNKQDTGVLKIDVRLDGEDRVRFQVEDDGIGREAARRLREKNFPKHASMGTVLTEERLRLINELNNVAFATEDLVDPHGQPAGTRVSIWVRF